MGKKILIVLFCLYLLSIAIGTRFCGGYSGVFTDTETGKPLSGVIVVERHSFFLPGPGGAGGAGKRCRETVTGEDGKFHLWPHIVIPVMPLAWSEHMYTEVHFFKPYYSTEGHPWTFIDGEQNEKSYLEHKLFTRGGENHVELTRLYTSRELSNTYPSSIIGGRSDKKDPPLWSAAQDEWEKVHFYKGIHNIYDFVGSLNKSIWHLMFQLSETQRAVYWRAWRYLKGTDGDIDKLERMKAGSERMLAEYKERERRYLSKNKKPSENTYRGIKQNTSMIESYSSRISLAKSLHDQFENNSPSIRSPKHEKDHHARIDEDFAKSRQKHIKELDDLLDKDKINDEEMEEWSGILARGLEVGEQLPFPVLPIDVARSDLPISASLDVDTDDPELLEFKEPTTGISFIRVPGGKLDAGKTKRLTLNSRYGYSSEFHEALKAGDVHVVYDVGDFFISKTKITQAQWLSLMERNPSIPQNPNASVNMVTPEGVRTFTRTFSKIMGKPFRLINLIEYEHLARRNKQPVTDSSGYIVNGPFEYGLLCNDYALGVNEKHSRYEVLIKTGDDFQCKFKPVILGHYKLSPWMDLNNFRENKSLMNEIGAMDETNAARDSKLGFRLVLPVKTPQLAPNVQQVKLY